MKAKLSYSQVWEDPKVIQYALQIEPGDAVLSVTGAGCNVFNLLLYQPRSIFAVDSSIAQNRLLRLKMAAIECLSRDEFALLFGIAFKPFPNTYSESRVQRRILFDRVLPLLDVATARFWQRNISLISHGIHFRGRFEQFQQFFLRFYKRRYRELWLPAFSEPTTPEDRERIYHSTIDERKSLRFNRLLANRITLRAFRTRRTLRDLKSFDFGKDILTKFRSCLMQDIVIDNYFLSSLLFRAYTPPEAVPPYLLPDNYNALKPLVGRIRVVDGTAEAFLSSQKKHSIDKFSLSNILEWSDPTATERTLGALLRVSDYGGRLLLHSTFIPVPEISARLRDAIVPLFELTGNLKTLSRSIFPTSIRAFSLHPE